MTEPSLPCADRPLTHDRRPVEIRVEDVHRAFNNLKVLRGVDLEMRQGEIVALVGGSGCGKTVLLDHIIGHLHPDRGRVLIANHDLDPPPLTDLATIDNDDMDRIRTHWAVVLQRNALFSGTVYENIALWLREVKRLDENEIRPRACAAIDAVDLNPDDVLNKDRDELSGGMAKRVAVARALAMEPVLMFYDEPTTGLDPRHARRIDDLVCETHRLGLDTPVPRTTLIITHDKDLLYRIEPRVIMLHEGRVFFDGSYRQFQESDSPVILPYFELMPALQQKVPVL
jgi:phospholipid/cholesterol/gamma-HCH transport system ATP-binding protein